ncbi:UNVERIFIED_CONTAM: hypothetical protein Sradi_5683300 [Sesamum radiatum]|uniref:Retrotransposon Copia-like N-terminal domain-containing protein n=1 Tax=Sesamum radiatum TaxID=300843 RepID=A0AAW2L0R3_SESRA
MAGEGIQLESGSTSNAQKESDVSRVRPALISTVSTDVEDLRVHTSDHLGMVLVSDLLVGNNCLLWSRSIKVALTAKMKLFFIDESYPKLAQGTDDFKQWLRTDSMVFS